MPFTNTWDKIIVRAVMLKKTTSTTFPVLTDVYVGLSTTTPTQKRSAGTTTWNFTEPASGAYARVTVAITGWEATTTEPTAGYEVNNTAAITFPAPTGSWGTVTYFGIFTHSTGKTANYLITFGALTTPKAIGSGDTAPSFAAKALKVKND